MTLQCGVQRVPQADNRIRNITSADLASLLGGGVKPFLLDVREPGELAMKGAIDGVKNIPVRSLAERLKEIPEDHASDIVVVCQSGGRSLEAAHMLQQLGYTRVFNLVGGTSGWIKSGYPVVKTPTR